MDRRALAWTSFSVAVGAGLLILFDAPPLAFALCLVPLAVGWWLRRSPIVAKPVGKLAKPVGKLAKAPMQLLSWTEFKEHVDASVAGLGAYNATIIVPISVAPEDLEQLQEALEEINIDPIEFPYVEDGSTVLLANIRLDSLDKLASLAPYARFSGATILQQCSVVWSYQLRDFLEAVKSYESTGHVFSKEAITFIRIYDERLVSSFIKAPRYRPTPEGDVDITDEPSGLYATLDQSLQKLCVRRLGRENGRPDVESKVFELTGSLSERVEQVRELCTLPTALAESSN